MQCSVQNWERGLIWFCCLGEVLKLAFGFRNHSAPSDCLFKCESVLQILRCINSRAKNFTRGGAKLRQTKSKDGSYCSPLIEARYNIPAASLSSCLVNAQILSSAEVSSVSFGPAPPRLAVIVVVEVAVQRGESFSQHCAC
jgi:hypothetical protein